MRKITIIGGGLAGLSLGVYLRQKNVPVEIIEAGSYPQHKVCGEFVCGVESHVLDELGIAAIMAQSVSQNSMSWWFGDSLLLQDRLPTQALGMSRYKMDEDLAGLFVQKGGILTTGQRARISDSEGVVWATGKRKKGGRWIGLKMHVLDVPLDGLEMHVGTRGYIGLSGIENGTVNCCGLFRINPAIKGSPGNIMQSYLEANGLDQLAGKFSKWNKDESSFSATAGFSFGQQPQLGRFCVGDASMLIPPFTGNGMSMALESAWLSGKWLARYAEGEIDWNTAAKEYRNESVAFFHKRMKLSISLQPLFNHRWGRVLLKSAAKSGLLPVKFLFHQLRTP